MEHPQVSERNLHINTRNLALKCGMLLVARREAVLRKVVARCGELGAQTASYVVADLSSLEGAKHLAAVSFI